MREMKEEILSQLDEIKALMNFSDKEELKFLRRQYQYCKSLLRERGNNLA